MSTVAILQVHSGGARVAALGDASRLRDSPHLELAGLNVDTFATYDEVYMSLIDAATGLAEAIGRILPTGIRGFIIDTGSFYKYDRSLGNNFRLKRTVELYALLSKKAPIEASNQLRWVLPAFDPPVEDCEAHLRQGGELFEIVFVYSSRREALNATISNPPTTST